MKIKPLFMLILIICLIFIFPINSQCLADSVAVIKSGEIKPYQDALAGFKEVCKVKTTEINIAGEIGNETEIAKKIKDKKPDLILAIGTKAAILAKQEISNIPIVFLMVSRPEKYGLTGKNITGVSLNIPAKVQFKTLKSIIPQLKTIGVIYNPIISGKAIEIATTAARDLGLELFAIKINSEKEVPQALRTLKGNIDAMWMVIDETVVNSQSTPHIILFTIRNKIPLMGLSVRFAQDGALLALQSDYKNMGRQSGKIANLILESNSINVMPIASPEKSELVLNLKTAKLIDIDIPPDVIKRASRIIK